MLCSNLTVVGGASVCDQLVTENLMLPLCATFREVTWIKMFRSNGRIIFNVSVKRYFVIMLVRAQGCSKADELLRSQAPCDSNDARYLRDTILGVVLQCLHLIWNLWSVPETFELDRF